MTRYSSDEIEQEIKDIWLAVLKLRDISPDGNFFDLGGESLGMIEMLFQVNQFYGIQIDPSNLFREPTLAGFSEIIGREYLAVFNSETGVL